MSPVPRLARRVTFLAFLLLSVAGVALAQEPEPIERVHTVGVIETEEGCEAIGFPAPCWDTATFVAQPGDTVRIIGDLRWSANLHNIHVNEGVDDAPKTQLAPSALHEVEFVMPAEGDVTFICDAHATSMIAHVMTPAAAAAAGGGHSSVPGLGVNFLAYWVGVIAFALLFIVYGLTFFLFKYNETPATTDQWDRSDATREGQRRFSPGTTSLLALVLAAALIGAIIYFARSG